MKLLAILSKIIMVKSYNLNKNFDLNNFIYIK